MSDPMIEIPEEMHLLATKTAAAFDQARVMNDELRRLQEGTAAERDHARTIIAGTMTALGISLSTDPEQLPAAADAMARVLRALTTMPRVLLGHNEPEPWARCERIYREDLPRMTTARKAGRRVLWSWHPGLIGSNYARVAAGEHDGHIRATALRVMTETREKVDAAFAHEGERKCIGHPAKIEKWGTAEEFVAAAERFRQVAVDPYAKARYVLCLLRESYNPGSLASGQGWAEILDHDGISYYAADPYSWFGIKTTRYPSIREMLAGLVTFGRKRSKPVGIWEIDGPQDPDEPEREADWLRAGLLSAIDLRLVTFCGSRGRARSGASSPPTPWCAESSRTRRPGRSMRRQHERASRCHLCRTSRGRSPLHPAGRLDQARRRRERALRRPPPSGSMRARSLRSTTP
ncbi:MAG: hypothetical protein WD556_11505 [Actinomycetota bacterium]